ncbi:hypothetical protein BT63DRAFT_452166 [Microthyrium microscopicum]|uniref:Uncharacterized protein n=1 Tax=Microthyrium microscopicum TaxID=703497 RepID=A0A6A6UHK1_9PEZI|nr:hypothetical protein BT63DRAFT_452166 [Microthyrium microscopicum]
MPLGKIVITNIFACLVTFSVHLSYNFQGREEMPIFSMAVLERRMTNLVIHGVTVLISFLLHTIDLLLQLACIVVEWQIQRETPTAKALESPSRSTIEPVVRTPYTLLTLPGEIRNQIYDAVFGELDHPLAPHSPNPAFPRPIEIRSNGAIESIWIPDSRVPICYRTAHPLLWTCRQSRYEARYHYLTTRTFHISIQAFPRFKYWCGSDGPQYLRHIRWFVLREDRLRFGMDWRHIQRICEWTAKCTSVLTLVFDVCDYGQRLMAGFSGIDYAWQLWKYEYGRERIRAVMEHMFRPLTDLRNMRSITINGLGYEGRWVQEWLKKETRQAGDVPSRLGAVKAVQVELKREVLLQGIKKLLVEQPWLTNRER